LTRNRGGAAAAAKRARYRARVPIDPTGEDPRPAGEAVGVPTPRARLSPIEIPTPEAVNEFFARELPSAYAGGHRCVETGPGLAVARWRYDAAALRPGGFISGPTQFMLADVAFWFLTFTVLGLAPMAVTSELYISFLRPAVGGDLVARAELLRAGKTKISGTVRIWVDGAPDRPVAHVTGSYVQLG
jgi:uncharacterized protein (TIGR00369 family)